MNTLALKIELNPRQPWTEILIAQLSELSFDAFEETETGFIAYGPEDKIDKEELLEITALSGQGFEYSLEFESIPQQNWNASWEADFHPVFVGKKLSILAPFHDQSQAKEINIIIQPKMSFGTGHHQTTWMMANAMLEEEKMPASVLDMGTGTGVLAILAGKLGAQEILAIDIEEWSVENTVENAERNGCKAITAKHGDVDLLKNLKFDLILANINKNVLKSHLNSYLSALNPQGKIMLSGFFDSDCDEMIQEAQNLGFVFVHRQTKETWAQLTFTK
ncbi:MAG: ribosomal protein methyltransferase [Crocinitomicaceae bacterium]|jgi:ribosomal protein L11 methyltransferase|nr:ribosomal protein methyltransferase [Crocinitomicaceae bacterium]